MQGKCRRLEELAPSSRKLRCRWEEMKSVNIAAEHSENPKKQRRRTGDGEARTGGSSSGCGCLVVTRRAGADGGLVIASFCALNISRTRQMLERLGRKTCLRFVKFPRSEKRTRNEASILQQTYHFGRGERTRTLAATSHDLWSVGSLLAVVTVFSVAITTALDRKDVVEQAKCTLLRKKVGKRLMSGMAVADSGLVVP